jgi:hypothetical protein
MTRPTGSLAGTTRWDCRIYQYQSPFTAQCMAIGAVVMVKPGKDANTVYAHHSAEPVIYTAGIAATEGG